MSAPTLTILPNVEVKLVFYGVNLILVSIMLYSSCVRRAIPGETIGGSIQILGTCTAPTKETCGARGFLRVGILLTPPLPSVSFSADSTPTQSLQRLQFRPRYYCAFK
jgi:hypothetical protein